MASSDIQEVRRRIKSVTSMEHITNAMKLVSAAKLRRSKATFDRLHEQTDYITHVIEEAVLNTEAAPSHYLSGGRVLKTTCYVIITGSRGLCGAFNSNVIKEAGKEIDSDWEEPLIVALGSKGRDYFSKEYPIYREYTDPVDTISFYDAQQLSKHIMEMYEKGDIDEIVLLYTSYVNQLEYEVKNIAILPLGGEPEEVERIEEERVISEWREVDYEPSPKEVFRYLVYKYVETKIYGAIVESATCEHAARRMAMESATDNARQMLDELSLYYNRARQAAITNEIIEIVAGSEAQR